MKRIIYNLKGKIEESIAFDYGVAILFSIVTIVFLVSFIRYFIF